MKNNDTKDIPIYESFRHEKREGELYRRIEHRYFVDVPIDDVLDKAFGLSILGGPPMCMKFDMFTQSIIDGKPVTVLIKESYIPVEET